MFKEVESAHTQSHEIKTPIFKELEVNGVSLKIVGINHTPEEFEKNQELFHDLIRDSSAIILEGFPQAADLGKLYSKKYPLAESMFDKEGIDFYRKIGAICEENRKDVIHSDPETNLRAIILGNANDLSLAAVCFGLASLGVDGTKKLFRQKVSRRSFLTGASLFGFGAVTSSWAPYMAADIIDRIWRNDFAVNNLSDFGASRLGLSFFNFRDVVVSDGIDQITKSKPNEAAKGPLVMFYGALHQETVSKYLTEDKIEREVRETLFWPIEKFSNPSVRQYHFNGQNWETVWRKNL